LVVSVTSSVSGVTGVSPASTGDRSARALKIGAAVEATVAQNGVGLGSGTGYSRGGASLPDLVASTFAAQAFAQQEPTSAILPVTRPPQQVAAAYQSTTAQAESGNAPDLLLPGLPPRLASGRTIDFSA
jgi:hypothetical protein